MSATSTGRRRPAGRWNASASTTTGQSRWSTGCAEHMRCSRHASTRNSPSGHDAFELRLHHKVCEPMTPVVRLLIFINAGVFLLQQMTPDQLVTNFALWPLGDHFVRGLGRVGFEPWQLVSSAFLHGNFAHIALNMFALYSFGMMVERAVGSRRFAWLYFASVLTASLA